MITKMPNIIDPSTLVKQQIKKRYASKCPCCGETRLFIDCVSRGIMTGISSGAVYSWYGKQYDVHKKSSGLKIFNPKNWFAPNHHWEVICCSCYTCGAKWETPPYPTDILNSEEIDRLWKKLISEEK